MNIGIGDKVKSLRLSHSMTLKQISAATGLSIGYLSNFERGQVSIDVERLEKVSAALGVDIRYFIGTPKSSGDVVVHKFDRVVDLRDERSVHYNLTNIEDKSSFLPRYVDLFPQADQCASLQAFPHEGEEFLYVLKGTLELWVNNVKYVLTEGDAAHYSSELPHKWVNATNQIVQLITANDINFYRR